MRCCSENCIFFKSNFSEGLTLSKNLCFFNFFFGILDKTFVVVIKTCILTFLGINFEEKCWLGKVLIFLCFGHWAKFFRSDSNILYREKEEFILLMQRFFFGEHIFKKRCNLHCLGVCAKNCQTPGACFPAELSKLPFLIPEEQCGFMLFLKKLSAHCFFLGFEWKTLQSHQTIFSRFARTVFFWCSEEHFR